MCRLRPFGALALCLVLALTAGAMAVARGQTHAAGTIVLCTGTGPVAVAVDAQGRPLQRPHICPDCALGLFDLPVMAPDRARPAGLAPGPQHGVAAETRLGTDAPRPLARAPPLPETCPIPTFDDLRRG